MSPKLHRREEEEKLQHRIAGWTKMLEKRWEISWGYPKQMFVACGKTTMRTGTLHRGVRADRSASEPVPAKTLPPRWSLLSPSHQVVLQHPVQPPVTLLQGGIPWAQVCNRVLGLRTDFLIPFTTGNADYEIRSAPGPPVGTGGTQPVRTGSGAVRVSQQGPSRHFCGTSHSILCPQWASGRHLHRPGLSTVGLPQTSGKWQNHRGLVFKKMAATSHLDGTELIKTQLYIVSLHLDFSWPQMIHSIFKSEITLKPNSLYYFCLFRSNWGAENVKKSFVWVSSQSCHICFHSEHSLSLTWEFSLSNSFSFKFKQFFQGQFLKSHKRMITSFLKRLFLQGITLLD